MESLTTPRRRRRNARHRRARHPTAPHRRRQLQRPRRSLDGAWPAPASAATRRWPRPSARGAAGSTSPIRASSAASCSRGGTSSRRRRSMCLLAAWLQFMVHDWLSHGLNDKEHPRIASGAGGRRLAEARDDHPAHPPGPESRTGRRRDGPRPSATTSPSGGTARRSTAPTQDAALVRSGPIPGYSLPTASSTSTRPATCRSIRKPPTIRITELELAGVNGNWWIGLSVMHTLFSREHNAIVDRLRAEYPDKDGEWLFQKARLINCGADRQDPRDRVDAGAAADARRCNTPCAAPGGAPRRGILQGATAGRGAARCSPASRLAAGPPRRALCDHRGVHGGLPPALADPRRFLVPPARRRQRASRSCTLGDLSGGGVRRALRQGGFRRHPLFARHELSGRAGAAQLSEPSPQDTGEASSRTLFNDLAAIDILRDRERGVPRYCAFRRMLRMSVPKSFAELTDNPDWQRELEAVYGDVEKVDLLPARMPRPSRPASLSPTPRSASSS